MKVKTEKLGDDIKRLCKFCGVGHYKSISAQDNIATPFFDLSQAGTGANYFKVFSCTHCGNIQLFSLTGVNDPFA